MAIACLPMTNGAREERPIFGMLCLYRCLTDSFSKSTDQTLPLYKHADTGPPTEYECQFYMSDSETSNG